MTNWKPPVKEKKSPICTGKLVYKLLIYIHLIYNTKPYIYIYMYHEQRQEYPLLRIAHLVGGPRYSLLR